uniref:Craniofacial development protein 2 n=1 Tax=Cacopsylla melanoneura TaxID=428564 RepID=A0A8D9A4P5_9HEMI
MNRYNSSAASDDILPRDLMNSITFTSTANSNRKKYTHNDKNNFKIATWNVCGLNDPGKLENVLNEIKNLNVDICGISETFMIDAGDFISTLPTGEKFKIFYSGGDVIRRKGVAIILNQKLMNHVSSIYMISERIITIKINAKPVNLFIIQCYAPMLQSPEEEKIEFYENLRKTINDNKQFQENLILLGDFNAKVGEGKKNDTVGPYGLGISNSSGDDLINFCIEHNLFLTNTWFEQKQSNRHTWTSPDGRIKNQIDYICMSKRFKNSVTNSKVRPGADCGSDHNPVVAVVKTRLKRLAKKNVLKKWDLVKAKCPINKNLFAEGVEEKLVASQSPSEPIPFDDVNSNWNNLKEAITTTAEEVFGKEQLIAKQKWMTKELLELMEERKKYKNSMDDDGKRKYKELRRIVQMKCREKREEFINKECEEAETLERVSSSKFHKKIKDIAGKKKNVTYCLIDENNKEIYDAELIVKRWKEYSEQLYNEERPNMPEIVLNDDEIPIFSPNDIAKMMKKLSNGKSCGDDNIPSEFIKLLNENEIIHLTNLMNAIYQTGHIPDDFLQSTFITLPKVNKAKHCSDFRTISLISHTSKILLQLIKQRINDIIENNLSDTQMGFRQGKGCRDAITLMRLLLEKHIEKGKDIFMTFIDYSKAFDNVNHAKMIEILEKVNISKADLRLIVKLYWGQRGKIKTSLGVSEEFQISKGVRQGCIISPVLFNIYVEYIVRESIGSEENGIQIGERRINNLRYADDLVLISTTKNGLTQQMRKLYEKSKEYSMKINIKKSKVMRVSKNEASRVNNIVIENEKYDEVTKYKYLGAEITKDAKCEVEIKKRIAMAKNAFWNHRDMMRRNVSRKTKLRLLNTYVFSILTYGCESWTLNPLLSARIQSFENWCYRRMLKVSWVERVRNTEILRRMGKVRFEWLNTIRERKLRFAGHVMRGSSGGLMLDVMKGDVAGRRLVGRPRRTWWNDILEWLEIQSREEFETMAQDRRSYSAAVTDALMRLATIDNDEAVSSWWLYSTLRVIINNCYCY